MEQPEYNLFHRQRVEVEYAPLYRDFGLGTTIWSPLASGILSGKYSQGIPEQSRATVEGYKWLHDKIQSVTGRARVEAAGRLATIAHELDATSAQLALAWCLAKPHISTAILGASRPEQLQENLGAIDVYKRIDEATMQRVEQITEPVAD